MSPSMIVIRPSRGWRHVDLQEVWRYRELLWSFTCRDVMVRYKQTLIGVAWAVIQPLLTMVVFSVFFGRLARVPSDGAPYPVFVYAGLLPWTLFAQGLTRSAESVVGNAPLIKKVYFPRLITPLSAASSALVDFLIAFCILLPMMAYYRIPFRPEALLFPLLVLLTFLASTGLGFGLAAVNAMYRDVRYAIPFLIQLGLFVTPVIYPVSLLPERFAWVMYLNPMAGIIEGSRALLLGGQPFPWAGVMLSALITALFFAAGVGYFRRMERTFADAI